MLTLEDARANRDADRLGRLHAAGARARDRGVRDVSSRTTTLAELRDYIDWQPFFNAWEMKGRFPDILNNPATGETARKLYDDAQEMLDRIDRGEVADAPTACSGFFPANAVGDDIEVYTDETRTEVLTTLHNLRQQGEHRDGVPNRSPRRLRRAQGHRAAPTTSAPSRSPPGSAARTRSRSSRRRIDDYNAILLESLADRLAEAFAERLHERVRKEFWGYAPDEQLDNEALIEEKYDGIRPAPGYPACPEHTEKADALGAARRRGATPASS